MNMCLAVLAGEVKSLASAIQAAQQPEIELVSGWLRSWGQPVPTSAGDGRDEWHGPRHRHDDRGRQAHARSASGVEFDRLFLTQMIQHHQGAIQMAKIEQTSGQNQDAVALAGRIIHDQTTKISKIQGMLKS